MDPIKSISGIIGIGKDVNYYPYTCRMCDMEDCIYRRTRENPNFKPQQRRVGGSFQPFAGQQRLRRGW